MKFFLPLLGVGGGGVCMSFIGTEPWVVASDAARVSHFEHMVKYN